MKIIAVTSGKGGTGKSCVAAYTGVALAGTGKKVLLLEQGATTRSLDLILGVQDFAVFNLADVLENRCEAEKAIVPTGFHENLFLLPAGAVPLEPESGPALTELLASLGPAYDYILVDGVDFSMLEPPLFDLVLMVLTPDSLSVRACAQHARLLHGTGVKLRLVINNVPARVSPVYGAEDFDDILDIVGIQLIAVIPASPKLQYSSNNAAPLHNESLTVRIFDNLAARLQGEQRPLLIR